MAADIDVRAVSNFFSVPEATVTTLLGNPTVELVNSLLHNIESKAKEYEQNKQQKVKLEVELETFVRTSESKAKVIQNSRDKALADSSKLRSDLQNAETARARVESELEAVKQSHTNEASEIVTLTSRIASLEAASRDTLSLLESKSSAYDRLSQDLTTQHQKVVELRKQVSNLEQSNQTSSSAVASARFREQSLQQEIELQKKNNEWLENERKIKADEHTNFRKEKNARITELQRLNEQYIDEAEALRRSESTFKTRLEEQVTKNEELLQEIQKLREREISDAESHRIELDSVNRLAELQKASADTAKERVEELSVALDEARDEAAEEIGRIRAEIQSEHNDREAAEQRVGELEGRISELQSELQQAQAQPATPRREINGTGISTPLRPSTPLTSFTPKSTGKFRANLTTTQFYSEYTKLERELADEKRDNEQLRAQLDSMVDDLETSRPEFDELRNDVTRLQSENLEMSSLVEQANQQRDATVKEAKILQGQLDATQKALLEAQQTLRDRNSQVRRLLMEQQGTIMDEADFRELEQAAAEAENRDMEHLSDSQQNVNRHLISFRNIEELQNNNERQLITIRNLVANLESAQAKDREIQIHQMQQELETARSQITSYRDEIQSMVQQSKSFVKERDMFRNMLTRRGQLPVQVDPTDFSRSMPLPAGGAPGQGFGDGSMSGGGNDYAKLLRDLQTHFDSYRQESSTDLSGLKNQVSELTKRNSSLQTESSKAHGQLTAANQRLEMIQANFNMLKAENAEIQKRSYANMETATKQELKTQQAAEELVEARGLLDSLRRDSANLKAEKDLWKSVEKRLVDDNEDLRNQRGRLDQLNGSLQNLLNEREQADSETRRRLQSQVETLDNELQTTKRRLNDEVEDSKKALLRREYDHEQSQKRVDDLVTSLGSTREELAAVKTTRDHLQARVDEMAVELRSAEERLEILSRPVREPSQPTNGIEGTSISQEQELIVELSELKRDLELKTAELERANEQIEVYKSISQQAEERLQELIETNEEYKIETESALTQRDEKVKDLGQRLEDISTELGTTNSELSKLRDEQSDHSRKVDQQRASLEAEISRLKESEEKMSEQAQFNLEASKAQAQIATEAQQNYENELLRHAEAAKTLHVVREDSNKLRLEMVDLKTQAETAKNDLEQKESSFSDMKDRYEREIVDLKKRREEINQQNTLLHKQLEGLTQQISALQRDRTALTEGGDAQTIASGSEGLNNLQEVIKYLRREKEIVDVQYHLSTQEAKRLRQQLDFAQSQLDETRLKLDQQRQTEADLERNAMSHNKLMETLTELNLYRESSVTLRAEVKQSQSTLASKTQKIEELEGELQPLQARVAELENLGELRDGEMKLLQEDRDHWQQRTQNILSKYDRVDPAELESLKTKISELETERDEAVAARAELQAQVDSHPEVVEAARVVLRERLSEQFKTRNREMTGRIREKQVELDTAVNEKTQLQSELDAMRTQLEEAKTQLLDASTSPTATQPILPSEQPSTAAATGADSSRVAELEAKVTELEAALSTKDQEIASLTAAHDQKFKARENELKEILNKRLAQVKQEANNAKIAALDELRGTLNAEHQTAIEALRAQTNTTSADETQSAAQDNTQVSDSGSQSPDFDTFLTSLTEAQAKLLVQKNDTVKNIVRSNIRKQVDKEKENLKQELAKTDPGAGEHQISAQAEELEKKFAAEKEAIINEKDREFAAEKDVLIKQHEEKLEAEKQSVIAEQQQQILARVNQEAEKKIAEQVAKAEALAEKKSALKFNMSEARTRTANAKLEVVKKAADETPDKPVKEVWEVAKDTKAPPAPPAKPVVPVNAGSIPTATPPQAEGANGQPDSTPEVNGTTVGQDGNETAVPPKAQVSALPQPKSALPQIARGNSTARGRGNIAQPAPNSHLAQSQSNLRGASSLPQRGGTNIRGGRNSSRGTSGNVSTNVAPAVNSRGGGTASPRNSLNPNATQFTPGGTKRPREGSEGGSVDGNAGKRQRGGSNAGTA